ncbi:MAG: YqgE/AlgH family protein [Bryobacteraceae bacterium]
MAVRGWLLGIVAALALAPQAPAQSTHSKDLAAGKLLVANRNLGDPNFTESVVLLVVYQDDAVVGLILNRRSRMSISSVFAMKEAKDRSDLVYGGGPVERASATALLRASSRPEGAAQVLDDIYLISSKSLLAKTFASPVKADAFRVFVGYAGWTGPQLRHEVEIGSWFIFAGDAKTIFDPDPRSLWSRMIDRTESQFALAGQAGAPQGPLARGF